MVPAEFLGVDLMFDNDIQLMVSIFHKAYQLGGAEERDPAKYVKTHKSDIEEAGQLFAYLDLAKPDAQSPLGWRPTPALMEIIANRAARLARPLDDTVSAEDRLMISLLCDAAFGKSRYPVCAIQVLRALGLVRQAFDGDLLTLKLLRLFADAYYDRKAGEREPTRLVVKEGHNIFWYIGSKVQDR
jgi:hypothetical protein